MQNCMVTILLACFLIVQGCTSLNAPADIVGDGSSQTPVSAAGESTQDETPQSVTDGSEGESAAGATGSTTPSTPAVAADSTGIENRVDPATDPAAEPATDVATEASTDVATEASPGETDVADAKPVTASATEVESVSTLSPAEAALLKPNLAGDAAPDLFKAKFTTSKGDFVIEVHREWAPNGADRLYNLVKVGFFTDVAFFRVIKHFVVQFGIHGEPDVNAAWLEATIDDDKVEATNSRGLVSFADRRSPNTRTTQLFINLAGRNTYLDEDGYAPIGSVIEGMDIVDSLYTGYGDVPPRGKGPSQATIQSQGNEYLKRDFPELDYIQSASIVE